MAKLLTLEDAAHDLLRAQATNPRHVGFRLDLWAALRETLAESSWKRWLGSGSDGPPHDIGPTVNIDWRVTPPGEIGPVWTGPASVADWSAPGWWRVSDEQPD